VVENAAALPEHAAHDAADEATGTGGIGTAAAALVLAAGTATGRPSFGVDGIRSTCGRK
jgi:hypothetical protein